MERYKILFSGEISKLQAEINEHIDSGYYPLGGVSAIFSEHSGLGFAQAVMLPDDEMGFDSDVIRKENI